MFYIYFFLYPYGLLSEIKDLFIYYLFNRNLKGYPKKLRDTAYISLIRPALEYSCSVWHPHKKSNKDNIEKVQRRAARFVSNNFRRKASVSEMLHNLGWQSLDSRRQDQRLVLFLQNY